MTFRCLVPVVAPVLLTFFSPGLAWGHADYEERLLTVQDRQGNSLTVVRHYMDGLVMTDPAKLVVYGPAQAVVAETPYYRDVVIYQAADGTLYVFGVGWCCVLFRDAWVLQDQGLVPTHTAASYGYALVAAFRTHRLGYGLTVLVCWAGACAYLLGARAAQGSWRQIGQTLALLSFIWLLLVLMYGSLSVPLILVLAGLGILPYLVWRGASRYVRGSGAASPSRGGGG